MIGRLRGTLVEQRGNVVVVECSGVGYDVTVSGHTVASLPELDHPVLLRIHTHVTDKHFSLFGFGSDEERTVFDLLITVKNVGPSSAMGILSGGAGPAEIARLIADENAAALRKLKGVGKKTADMIVVELQEKCQLLLMTWGASGTTVPGGGSAAPRKPRPPLLDDVAAALAQLGYRPADVQKVTDELDFTQDADLEAMLRHALRAMPR